MFGQNAFRNMNLACFSGADSQLFQLNIADTTLTSSILELVRFLQSKFLPDKSMALAVLGVRCQITELLLLKNLFDRFGNFLVIAPIYFPNIFDRRETQC